MFQRKAHKNFEHVCLPIRARAPCTEIPVKPATKWIVLLSQIWEPCKWKVFEPKGYSPVTKRNGCCVETMGSLSCRHFYCTESLVDICGHLRHKALRCPIEQAKIEGQERTDHVKNRNMTEEITKKLLAAASLPFWEVHAVVLFGNDANCGLSLEQQLWISSWCFRLRQPRSRKVNNCCVLKTAECSEMLAFSDNSEEVICRSRTNPTQIDENIRIYLRLRNPQSVIFSR